ncbi:hypothetical protein ACK3Z1_06045 [Aeromonas caviae]|uniref:hypothetical protein n=1 Tax=Aeromonas caviae TaxID=648 RepID=UPI0039F9C52F
MAIDSTTLTNDKLYIDVTITASGTDVATERLSVELYNQSGSAVVGQHYNDGISQLVRFDPTTCQAVLDAAGNPTYAVRMTARDLVVYARQASPPPLGLRSGTGTNVITKPIAITVQGVNIDNGGNDGGDNDGCSGSTGPLSQLTLVSFGLVRQFKRS